MKVIRILLACIPVIVCGQPAIGQSDDPASISTPGRLVESASPNTSVRLPGWTPPSADTNDPPVAQAGPPDGLNVQVGAADHRDGQAQPPGQSLEQTSRQEPGTTVLDRAPRSVGSVESPAPSGRGAASPGAAADVVVGDRPSAKGDRVEPSDDPAGATVIPRDSAGSATTRGDEPDRAGVGGRSGPGAYATAPWYRHPLVALVVIVAMIGVIALVFRRYVPASRMIPMRAVRLVGRAPISARHSVALLQVGRRVVLVGMTADRVQTLSEITDPQEVSLLLGTGGEQLPDSAFGRQLSGALDVFDSDAAPDAVSDRSLVDETRGQLQNLMRKLRSLRAA